MKITVIATVTLTFDTADGLVETVADARNEMRDYLLSGPSTDLYDYTVSVIGNAAGPTKPKHGDWS